MKYQLRNKIRITAISAILLFALTFSGSAFHVQATDNWLLTYFQTSDASVPNILLSHVKASRGLRAVGGTLVSPPDIEDPQIFKNMVQDYGLSVDDFAGVNFSYSDAFISGDIKDLPTPYTELSSAKPGSSGLSSEDAIDPSAVERSALSGGVTIGQSPSDSSQVDIADIDWKIDGNSIYFTITDSQGKKFKSDAYQAEVANLALLYAADRRVATVTIIPVQSKTNEIPNKILLHPALVNTQFGRNIIDLDELIFRYNYDLFYNKLVPEVGCYIGIYQYAATLRYYMARDYQTAHQVPTLQTYSNTDVYPDIQPMDTTACDLKELENRSPLVSKESKEGRPDFFDPAVVNLLIEYGKNQSNTSPTLDSWLYDNFLKQIIVSNQSALNKWQDKDLFNFADHAYASHITEQTYTNDLSSLLVTDWNSFEPLFNYSMQITFNRSPVNPPSGTKSANVYIDPDPWKFPVESKNITDTTLAGIKADKTEVEILHNVSEFTMLQRLFRVILYSNGNSNKSTVMQKLVNLSEQLHEQFTPANVHTPIWDISVENYSTSCNPSLLQLPLIKYLKIDVDCKEYHNHWSD